jgi:hypothetical protein
MGMTTTTKASVQVHAGLQFTAFLIVLGLASSVVWFYHAKSQLVCAPAADAAWHLAYVDGRGVSKFMWAIEPRSADQFVACLQENSFDVSVNATSGLMQADNAQGVTIANSIGDGFVTPNTYYQW